MHYLWLGTLEIFPGYFQRLTAIAGHLWQTEKRRRREMRELRNRDTDILRGEGRCLVEHEAVLIRDKKENTRLNLRVCPFALIFFIFRSGRDFVLRS